MHVGVGLLDTDVMPIFHNHCLEYRHNFVFFYQLLDSNLFTHRIICLWEKPLVKPMAPRSIFHHISFWSTILRSFTFISINQKTQKYFIFCLVLFIYLYQISPLQVIVKGLTTPLSCWVQVFDCLCRYWWFACSSPGLIPWFLPERNICLYCASSLFSLQGKNQRNLKK